MPTRLLLASFAVVSLAILGPLTPPRSPASEPDVTKLNTKIDNLHLRDSSGKPVTLPETKATVVAFLSFECPVSNSYAAPLAELAREYGPKGVSFIGLVPGDTPPIEVEKQAKEFRFGFPVYKDDGFAAADALKAATTPEVFVLDRHSMLRYRGRIDNGYQARLRKNPQVTSHDLKNALDDLLAGKPVRTPATPSVGCPIVRERPAPVANAAVTYHRDVAPIMQAHCQTCHRAGEVGPFSLTSYKQAVNWAADIKDYTGDRRMPPWKPAEASHAFADDRRLSDKDIATLAAWVDAGMPEGDPKDAPPPAKFINGWQLGPPDLILTPPTDFTVGPSGTDLFRCYALPTGLHEDKYVVAYEVRPGNPRVVHHTLNFIDTSGRGRTLERDQQDKDKDAAELPDHGPGYSRRMGVGFLPRGGIGGWAPGQQPHVVPDGVGFYLPKNSDLVIQVHYHRTGRVESDRTQVGLYFAKKPVERTIEPVVISPKLGNVLNFLIPPGVQEYPIKGSIWLAEDCTVYSVMPHMHLIGRRIKVTMTPPGGQPETLISIKDWDYNWQETYYFKEPFRVKAGTRFDIEGVYDNSRNNPFNPSDPPQMVRFGEQTTNEMCFGFLQTSGDKPGPVRWYLDEDRKILLPPRRLRPAGR
jgi:thiol-disulfide isomerase/thioredoxin/mono/diheme cytochrome c family protein